MAANPYDPVTTTDSTHLTDDAWGLSLPPIKYKRYSGSSRFKSLCSEIKQRPKWFIIGLVIIALLVVVTIVIVAASGPKSKKAPTGKEADWQSTDEGLEFYPVPENKKIVINFSPKDFKKFDKQPLKTSLDEALEEYKITTQIDKDIYTDCSNEYHPENKTCRWSTSHFGDRCTQSMHYGYSQSQPCVLVKLNLPADVVIYPIDEKSPLWPLVKATVKKPSKNNIPLMCEGTTEEDQKFMNSLKVMSKDGKAIDYFPEEGFPAYFYRKRDTTLPFITPAVMIQLTSLLDKHMVHITCKALGQLYDLEDKLIDHDLLTTTFAIYINHG